MKLKDIYKICIDEGIKTDLRKKDQINKYLLNKKKEYKSLESNLKKFFDKESLTNPYSDTRILFGSLTKDIKRVLVGIDIDPSEILLADRLAQKGKTVDLVLAHHPEGRAWASFYDVMNLQTDVLSNLGIELDVAKDLMDKRIDKVSRRVHGSNHQRSTDVARLLKMPFMCCHTPADNHVASFLQKMMDKTKPMTLKAVVSFLLKEPEYKEAAFNNAGPKILIGNPKDKAGKVFVDMTGGTEGSKDIFPRMSQLGIKTLVCMHLSEEHFKKAKSEYLNVIIAGHIASDNLGINLLLDKVTKKEKLDILECSGYRRFKR
ncbi:MAG: NGG1p interacting factor NIF3 [Candidatus Zapsychrus exili]|nr:NGG1p interacting factor NIF3 [Candidatus Zapsychrus exili]